MDELEKTMSLKGGIKMYTRELGTFGGGECKGRKVFFLGKNGYDMELDLAKKVFKVGEILTVKEIYVGRSSSEVSFQGIDGKFNTVMFSDFE